jgi:hypothetical protein
MDRDEGGDFNDAESDDDFRTMKESEIGEDD